MGGGKKYIDNCILTSSPLLLSMFSTSILLYYLPHLSTLQIILELCIPEKELAKTRYLPVTYWFGRFVPSTGIFTSTALWKLYVSGFDSPISKYLQLMQGSWVRILCVNFITFSSWHPWFKSGFHSSFWDFIFGIWKWGMASSFWNHVIQISMRQVHYQDIYSQLWIVKIFTDNIYFL
jgi:hypothetical protein